MLMSLAAAFACGALPAQTALPPGPLVVVLIGPPLSGKTTQADYLRRRRGLAVISIEELRAAAGKRAADPKTIDRLLRERVQKADRKKGFVIDGYPATREQADNLGALVKEFALPSPLIVQLNVPDETVRERARKRGSAQDSPEIVNHALAAYQKELALARSYYPEADIWTIDGERTPSDVWETIESLLADRK
jgi:adenylate kinase